MLLKRISKSSTGDFVRRTKHLLDEHNEDDKFVQSLQLENSELETFNVELRKEAVDVLLENEQIIWVSSDLRIFN